MLDENKNLVSSEVSGNFFEEITCIVGNTYFIDGIQVICIKEGNAYAIDNIYLIDLPHSGDTPIFVDKNHDLSYYVKGSDYVDSGDYEQSPGTFGYEWGGYNTETGITSTGVGTGLSNTNALIGMNLQPETEGWWVVWDKVMDFRSSYGHNWFVPSKDELNLIYKNRSNLSNLSLNTYSWYWSSSEFSSNKAYNQSFNSGGQYTNDKRLHYNHVRLCRQL